jgi:hypothetical protein
MEYLINKESAGERKMVIVRDQAIKVRGKSPRKTWEGETKVTIHGMAINRVEDKITPREIRGKRVANFR